MKAHWSWLLELTELDRKVDVAEGAAILTRLGLEVEDIERPDLGFSGVVVAEVKAKRKHPDAKKLTLVTVDDGSGTTSEVVCGAPNVPEPGFLVLWARPGSELPGGMKIGSRAIKGIESPGMLCAEDELGLGEDHGGIIVLQPQEAKPGDTAQTALGLSAVFDVGVPANRPDALGHIGLARELVAAVGGRVKWPDGNLEKYTDQSTKASEIVQVEISDGEGCKRYVGRSVNGVTIGSSPTWMRTRLAAVGVRPINSLVDVTNYVMFELGHPLHAFDVDSLNGNIVVRRAKDGEKMKTLDEEERKLSSADLVIADKKGPVALAGVMGGFNTQVTDSTKTVFLEAAAFEPILVRKTAKRVGLHSESSYRFERFVDPNGVDLASRRACALLAEVSGGKVVNGVVDVFPKPVDKKTVTLRTKRANSLTGLSLDAKTVESVLTRLELEVGNWSKDGEGEVAKVTCPSFRSDLGREVDLIEEVLRHHGYDKVPDTLPRGGHAPTRLRDEKPRQVRRALTASGFSEAITFGFFSKEKIAALGLADSDLRTKPVEIRNPMSAEQAVMRTSLVPNLLESLSHNIRHGQPDVAIFEVGSVFFPDGDGVREEKRVAGVLSGYNSGWLGNGPAVDFFDMKAAVVALVMGVAKNARLSFSAPTETAFLHPGVSALVRIDEKVVGSLGEVHPTVRASMGLDSVCFVFDISLDGLPNPPVSQMVPIPMYPSVARDVSFFVGADVPAAEIQKAIFAAFDAPVERVHCLEDYRDPAHVPEGQKGMLWSIVYRAEDRTLTDAEVDKWHEGAVAKFLKTLGATRR